MSAFSADGQAMLFTCDPRLQTLFLEVVKTYDCQIQQGSRTVLAEQDDIDRGVSSLKNPMDSLHVVGPSRPLALAVDVAPYPVVWPVATDPDYLWQIGRFYHFAGYVLRVSQVQGIALRWGGSWDGPTVLNHHGRFQDYDHFELVEAS